MSKHKIAFKTDGCRTESGRRWPVCSCGWEGSKVGAYNDYQHKLNRDEADAHLHSVAHRMKEGPKPVSSMTDEELLSQWEGGMYLACQEGLTEKQEARLDQIDREMSRRRGLKAQEADHG